MTRAEPGRRSDGSKLLRIEFRRVVNTGVNAGRNVEGILPGHLLLVVRNRPDGATRSEANCVSLIPKP